VTQSSQWTAEESLNRNVPKNAGSVAAEPAHTGIAGVSPASSNGFTQGTVESDKPESVAFNEGGRDARGPSKSGPAKRGGAFQ
jgi:hypothetical protein